MISNLLRGFAQSNLEIDLLSIRSDYTDHLGKLPQNVNRLHFRARHNLSILPELISYLRARRPRALLAAKDRAIFVSALAKKLSGVPVRVVGRLGTNVSAGIRQKNPAARAVRRLMMQFSYETIDAAICVSKGVAYDLASITGLPVHDFFVVKNPVITPELQLMAGEAVDHPWIQDKTMPLIIGMGRLTLQKDFETLIRAFDMVRYSHPSRLIILGEGKKRRELQALIHQSGLEDVVDLPGFQPNPYPYLKASDLFVLSSQWEGSPNALTEAMALGIPVVSTDCPSGPREILDEGRLGPLVPMKEPEAMAEAILKVLKDPPPKERLMKAVEGYSLENSGRAYLKLLIGD